MRTGRREAPGAPAPLLAGPLGCRLPSPRLRPPGRRARWEPEGPAAAPEDSPEQRGVCPAGGRRAHLLALVPLSTSLVDLT